MSSSKSARLEDDERGPQTRFDADRDEQRVPSESFPRVEVGRPTQLGRYVILEEVGRGGMGVVWTAYDPKLDRKVAIKLLAESRKAGTRQARFIREAQALAKLSHPNIVTVHDVDTHEGRLYMAMELVDGQTLHRWLKKPRQWREILQVFSQAGRGLAAAHAADITHRDFKPANVLIAKDGRVKVLDFGLAKDMARDPMASVDEDYPSIDPEEVQQLRRDRLEGLSATNPGSNGPRSNDIMEVIGSSAGVKLTKVGRIVGTPAYMAPEQYPVLGQHEVGVWTDQFSFAVALYEALFGMLPFSGNDLMETYDSIHIGRIREPRRDSVVPSWVLRILHQALREDPHERFGSMDLLLEALAADPARRRRRIALAVGGVGLVALSGFGVVQALSSDEPTPCQGARDRLAGVWDANARTTIERGLVDTGLPFAADTARRATERLDRYADAWVAQRTAVCEATRIHGEQSEALLDVRMTCLDRRSSELGALVKVLSAPEEQTVSRAITAVAGLRRPEPCATAKPGVESALPEEPTRRARFMELQAKLDDVKALMAAGRHTTARDRASEVAEASERQGFRRLLADAKVSQGSALRNLEEADKALPLLREGILVASEVADVRTEVVGWSEMFFVTGLLLEEPGQAMGLQFAAEAALERAGSPKDLESRLKLHTGAVLLKQNRFEDATRVGEDALRVALEAGGHGSPQHAQALNNLGVVAAKQADWAVAERRLRESLELKKQLFGPEHPDVARNSMNLANVLVQVAKKAGGSVSTTAYDEAEQLYEKVVAFRERTYGPASAPVARTLANLGLLQGGRGDAVKARRSLERARSLMRELPGVEGDLARTLNNLAGLDREALDYDSAERWHREALAIQLKKYGEAHLSVGRTRLQLCQVLADAKREADALAECSRALAVLETSFDGRPNPALVSVHTILASTLRALGKTNEASRHQETLEELQRRLDGGTNDEP